MEIYNPFADGAFAIHERTQQLRDSARSRVFVCETWYPDSAGRHPLVLFSHSSGGNRRQSTFLCRHLAGHGYVVAALDHSEISAPELARKNGETPEETATRTDAWISSRVPDLRLLLDFMAGDERVDASRVGIVGHSFGGWTVLATPDVESRVGAIVALAPAGASVRKPGIIPATLAFNWNRDVPTLYLVAENDSALPLDGMHELLDRTPASKQMVVLRRADHLHFMDDVEERHEAIRKMAYPGVEDMRPIAELCSGAQAHLFVKGLALAHLDAVLRENPSAQKFLRLGVERELALRDIQVWSVALPPERGQKAF